MDTITEYKEIIKKEIPYWDEETLKKHPEWSEDKIRIYEIKEPTDEDKDITLMPGYVELCDDYKDCHIIKIGKENWIGYYNTEKEEVYIEEEFPNAGITKEGMEYLTNLLKWDDYKIYTKKYPYVPTIRKRDKDTTFEERIYNATIGNYLKD